MCDHYLLTQTHTPMLKYLTIKCIYVCLAKLGFFKSDFTAEIGPVLEQLAAE